MRYYYVYILASGQNGTLYIGITHNLEKRTLEHQFGIRDGFTKKYRVTQLVYFEEYTNPKDAIAREKQLKWWKRKWKIGLIEKINPHWEDLSKSTGSPTNGCKPSIRWDDSSTFR